MDKVEVKINMHMAINEIRGETLAEAVMNICMQQKIDI